MWYRLTILKIYDLMQNIGGKDYTLIVMVFFGLYQELYLENYGSYLKNYSMYYPILSINNPAFYKSFDSTDPSDSFVVSSFIPNYLWILISFDLFNLKVGSAINNIDNTNQELYNQYMNIINDNIENAITKSCNNTSSDSLDNIDINLIKILIKLLKILIDLEEFNNSNFKKF